MQREKERNMGTLHTIPEGFGEEHQELVHRLTYLPHKILRYHHLEVLPHIVLHDISQGFDLSKSIYLVDNPDFDHLKGISGYAKDECKYCTVDLWEAPENFQDAMKDAKFFHDVRAFLKHSLKRNNVDLNDSDEVLDFGRDMGLENPQFFAWNMKYGNHGLLLFDEGKNMCTWRQGLLKNAAALLSFAGI